jgi:hypothetical protein
MMTGHGDKLSRKAELAIAALLDRPTVTEAAAAVRVDESTLRAWMRDPDFRAAYRAARAAVLERTVARLVAASVQAVEALERNLTAARPADQIRAALGILSHVTNGLAVSDLSVQVQELGELVRADQQARDREQAGPNDRSWQPRHLGPDGNGDGNGDGSDHGGLGRRAGSDPGDPGGDGPDPGPGGDDHGTAADGFPRRLF